MRQWTFGGEMPGARVILHDATRREPAKLTIQGLDDDHALVEVEFKVDPESNQTCISVLRDDVIQPGDVHGY